jgi:hypothetical protein
MMRADKLDLVPVIITGGNSVTREGGFWHVPNGTSSGPSMRFLEKGNFRSWGSSRFEKYSSRSWKTFALK